jgi:CBS-domain-containing membrane protein
VGTLVRLFVAGVRIPRALNTMNEQIARTAPAVPLAPFKQAAFGFLGGFLAIGVISLLGHLTSSPLLIAPFGASSVLLFGAPDSAFAQPRNLVFGHLLSTAVGLAVFWFAGPGIWQMALSVGLAIALMQLTRCVHPPAGADPLVIIFVPVLSGVCVLLVTALLFNNVVRGRRWPERWS